MTLDHFVISVRSLKSSIKFYAAFLGKPVVAKWGAQWDVDGVKLFLVIPYKKNARKFDKHNLGLNHIAFKVRNVAELKKYLRKLDKAKIKNSGIQIDQYSRKPFVWFDDPDGIRLEFYLR